MRRKPTLLVIVLAALYLMLACWLMGCATFIPERPMVRPWNFPEAREWNQPLETSWQNAVDNWRRLTTPKTKTLDGMTYEYDEVTDLYFPNLVEYADWQDPEYNP